MSDLLELLWRINPESPATEGFGPSHSIENIKTMGSDSLLKIERRIVHLVDGDLFLLRATEGGRARLNKLYHDHKQWSNDFSKLYDEYQKRDEAHRQKIAEDNLIRIGRGKAEALEKATSFGTIKPVVVFEGKPLENWMKWDEERVYVKAERGCEFVFPRSLINEEMRHADLKGRYMRNLEEGTRLTQTDLSFYCEKCGRYHNASLKVMFQA